MKKVIQIVLGVLIVVLAVVLFEQIKAPIRFKKQVAEREIPVIERIKEIRSAEQAYKQVYLQYTSSFDTLINFVLNDSMTFIRQIGSQDDSAAVARGEVYREEFRIPVIDTVFSRQLTPAEVRDLRYIPGSEENKEYILDAGFVMTESGVIVPVFECRAPYNYFLTGLNRQAIDNLIDERLNTLSKYPGIQVGSMESATNDVGNWE